MSNHPTAKRAFGQPDTHSGAALGYFLLCVYTALVLIRPHEWPVLNIQFPILRTVLIATFCVYLISLRPKIWNTQCTILVLMFFAMLMSEVRAFRYFSDLSLVIDWINSNTIPFILYLGFLSTIARQKIILLISVAACLVMTQHAYIQVNDPFGQGWAESVIYRNDGPTEMMQARYIGIFNDPNDMGMFLVMNIPIAVFFLTNAKRKLIKLLWCGVLAALFLGIYWTGSRGSLVGLMAVLFSFFYLRFGKVKSLVLAGLSIPALLVIMGSFRSISKDDESSMQRLTAWYEGIQMLGHRPLFGFGKGRFLEYHPKVAHNSFVTIMAELGSIGYILWMTFLFLCFFMLFKVVKLKTQIANPCDKLQQEILLATYLVIALIGYCATAFFISRSFIMFLYIFAAMSAACFVRCSNLVSRGTLQVSGNDIFRLMALSAVSLLVLCQLIIILLKI
ncbi:O-antigen ligase family protein [Alteromonas gracilis]|uniref:Polymerase n=1 Tax=Alteromonas gracilis TaxID=1479524 RepID=A0ABX5CN55_9ALTE|nr:O-antigen ligase family protein [Alteromonas gracilis]PRO68448.1 polymerase [Alteromonas gracilis]